MNRKQLIMLVTLSAIWGASFMFMRILSPVLGPVLTASFRLIIGGVVLFSYYWLQGIKIRIFSNWKLFLLIGSISLAFPYFLFSLAALYIPSGISAVLNSTTPMFSFLMSVFLFHESIHLKKIFGLLVGTTGVIVISMQAISLDNEKSIIGVLACLGAAFLYAVAGVLIKSLTNHIDSKSLAVGNQLFAGLVLLPFVIFFPIQTVISIDKIIILIIFGTFGSGVASLIYFTLIKEVGALKAFTVTYLLPFFGLFWGFLILGEPLNIQFFIGLGLIIPGIMLITRE